MCPTPSPAAGPTQLNRPFTDAEFGELICADQDLLHAEFDAIVATEWPTQPPATGRPPGRTPDRPGGPREVGAAPAAATQRLPRDRRPDTARVRRPRSPPGTRMCSNV